MVALVGRLAPWKGQRLFLDALELLADQGIAVRGLLLGAALFGESDYADEIAARLAAPPLAGTATLDSFSGDVSEALTDVDIVVSASVIAEPFGQVVVEAIANGVPVVVPDQGGPAEIVEDGLSGLTYRSGDAADLAATIARLAGLPDLDERLSEGGLRRAEVFSPEEIAAEFGEFARSVRRLGLGQRMRRLVGRAAPSSAARSQEG